MTGRLLLLSTSPLLPAGLLSWAAWEALRSAPVLTRSESCPQVPAVRAAGIDVEVVGADADGDAALASLLWQRARSGTVVWLAGPDGDPGVVRSLAGMLTGPEGGSVQLEVLPGSYEPPGARLLELVSVMDRLRSAGGCPWDAEQTHDSLAKYLLEEAYEAVEAIEQGDAAGLREELGDVLLQVVFHARLAQEAPGGEAWDVDDVAAGLVDKLVRRHPHVFADRSVSGAAEVEANWDAIKTAEKSRTSVTEGVPMGQPALTLAATLQRRAARLGMPTDLMAPWMAAGDTLTQAVCVAAAALTVSDGDPETSPAALVGDLLFTTVALARSLDVEAESALRGSARRFRDRLEAAEAATRAGDVVCSAPADRPD